MPIALDVLEDRALAEWHQREPNIRQRQHLDFAVGLVESLLVDAQQAAHAQPQSSRSKRAVGRGAAETPAPQVVAGHISRCRTYDYEVQAVGHQIGRASCRERV